MKVSKMEATLLQHMGTDLEVVNAARVSFDKESEWVYDEPDGWDPLLSGKDEKLINYLARHNHFTPFTHCSATFRIKVPIFVARQLHKHQVGFTVNEVSRRYVDSEPEFYFPEVWRAKAENVKQGSSNVPVELMDSFVEEGVEDCLGNYQMLLDNGVAPEQARMVLPQNTMTEFWMTGSLYGWARLCRQRLDSHAQKEVQEVAQMINDSMRTLFPVSWKALMEN